LQEAAFSLEQSLQAEPAVYTPEQLDVLEKELQKSLKEFEPFVIEAESKKPDAVEIDSKKLASLLNKIKPLLEKGDFSAVNFVDDLQRARGMEELARMIDDYDFEGALNSRWFREH